VWCGVSVVRCSVSVSCARPGARAPSPRKRHGARDLEVPLFECSLFEVSPCSGARNRLRVSSRDTHRQNRDTGYEFQYQYVSIKQRTINKKHTRARAHTHTHTRTRTPSAQTVQAVAPIRSENSPAGHGTHAPAPPPPLFAAKKYPREQPQSVRAAPAGSGVLMLPAGFRGLGIALQCRVGVY